jgi:acyl-CoA thioesterase YciA
LFLYQNHKIISLLINIQKKPILNEYDEQSVVMTENYLPEGMMPVLRLPARPQDANEGGSIFGGWIMSNVDIAGSVPALERAKGPVVTRAVDSFEFKKPVFVGDLVSCYAKIVETGRTSIKVKVEVFVERLHKGETTCEKVTEATLVYVAIDENRKPRALPD